MRCVLRSWDRHIRFSINSDDPGIMSGGSLPEVYEMCHSAFGLGVPEMQHLNSMAFEDSFVAEDAKRPVAHLFGH